MKMLKGDLLQFAEDGNFDVIIHGCNCFCQMGKGIALTIKNKFPDAYKADLETAKGEKNKLGTYSKAEAGNFTIVKPTHNIIGLVKVLMLITMPSEM
jgi:O-acetyl-ADP-ribose deacetylase (regulator of RNase III)